MKRIKLSPMKAINTFLLLVVIAFPTFAIEVNDLYRAQVLVDNTPTGKQKASQKALKQVFVKLAGENIVGSNKEITQ